MKRFVLGLLILVSSSLAFSQKLYFIYLQSENDQPFFLKMNDKIHSSSASGYLILSKLRDSSYTFSVGFPQNKFPEQNFTVDIKGKDRGYLLKNFGERGWGLFDLQTLNIQMALPDKSKTGLRTEPRDDISPFTEILAKASNDPSLRERPVAVKMEDNPVVVQSAVLKEEVKPLNGKTEDKQPAVAGKEESAVAKNAQPAVNNDPVPVVKRPQQLVIEIIEPAIIKGEATVKTEETKISPPAGYKRSVVTKKSESSTSEGFGLTYIDEFADGKKDTIRIVIPNLKTSAAESKEKPKEEKKFLDISVTGDSLKQPGTAAKEIKREDKIQKQFTNADCKAVASENDLSKLQKKMISEKTDDDMVAEAKKVFKAKCFTSGQLKSLSSLFLNDAGKYKFFDAAYAYVSDTENFPSLSAELKDEYYINRFKAMLR